MDNDQKLIIPENCPPMDYLINGFTKTDAAIVVLWAIISAVIAISIYTNGGNSIIAVAIFLTLTAIPIIFLARDKCTENVIDKIKILLSYKTETKCFEYEFRIKDEMETIEEIWKGELYDYGKTDT